MSEHETSNTGSTVQVAPEPEEDNALSFSVSAFIDDTLQITEVNILDEDNSCEPEEELHPAINISPIGEHSASLQSAKSLQPLLVTGDFEVETESINYELNEGAGPEVENNIETAIPSCTAGSFIDTNLVVSCSNELSEAREEKDRLSTAEFNTESLSTSRIAEFNIECLSTSEIEHAIDLSEEEEISLSTESNDVRAIYSVGDAPSDAVHETSDRLEETLAVSKLHNISKNESFNHIDFECQGETDAVLTIEHFGSRLYEGTLESSEPSSCMPNTIENDSLNQSKEMIESQSENIPHSSSINKVNEKSVDSVLLDETLCLSKLHNLSEYESYDEIIVEIECQKISDPVCESLTFETRPDNFDVDSIKPSDPTSGLYNLNEDSESKEISSQSENLHDDTVPKSPINEMYVHSVHTDPLDETICLSQLHNLSETEPLDHSKMEMECPEKSDSPCESLTNKSKQNSHQGDIIEYSHLSLDLPNVLEDVPVSLNESEQITELEYQEKSDSFTGNGKLNVGAIASSDPSSDLPIKIEENHVPCLFYESTEIPVNTSQYQLPVVNEINEKYLGTDILDGNPCTSESYDVPREGSFDHKEMETKSQVIGVSACESLAGDGKEPDASLIETNSNSSAKTNFNYNNRNSSTHDMSITLLDNAESCQVLEYDSPLDVSESAIIDSKIMSGIKNINNFNAFTDQKPGDAMYLPTSDSNENNTMTCESGTQQSFMEITFANGNPIILDQSSYCNKFRTSDSEYTLGEDSYNTISNLMCADNCVDGNQTVSEVPNNSHHVMQSAISDHVSNQNLSLAIPDTNGSPVHMSNLNSLDKSSEDSRLQCEQQTEHTLLMKWPVHYHAELEKLQSQNQLLMNELESKSDAYSKLEADNLNTKKDLKEALEKCEHLNEKINHLEESLKQERVNNNNISDLMHTNERLLIEIGVLKNIERLYEQMKENEDEMVKQLKSKTSEEVKLLEDKISSLETELSSAHNNGNDLQLKYEIHSKVNSNLEETIESLNKNILETKKELSDLCMENKQLQNLLKLQKEANDVLENKTIYLKEDIAVLKSQNEACWKGIVQRSDHEELVAITKENCKLHENIAFHKSEVAGLKLQCEIITKELESTNNTITELKTYKKKWKSSLMNLNVQLNMVEAENEERKEENEKLKLELESERSSLQEELRSLSEFISSLTLERVALIEQVADDERTIQDLSLRNHEHCLSVKLIEEENSSLANKITWIENQVESLFNINSTLSSELESERASLQEELRYLSESISSLTLERFSLIEQIAGDERTIQDLSLLYREQCLSVQLIEEEKSSLVNEITRLENQVESLCNTNSILYSELDSCKKQLSDMDNLIETNSKLNEVINTLERNIHSYEEENEHNGDKLRGLGETLVSVMMSQDVESFQNMTILEDLKKQVSQLAQKTDRLDELLKIEREKVKQISDINANLSNELKGEKENLSRVMELESTVSELNNYIISLNEELMSEIFKFDALTYAKLDLETMLDRLTKENDEIKINLNLAMSESQRLVDEKDELLESAKISEQNVSSLRSDKEKLMFENAELTSSLDNCNFKINDLEKYCLENNNLKNTMINEIKSLTSNSDTSYHESCSINDVFVKLMSVFLHKEEEVIFELQNSYEDKIKSLQCSIDLQNSVDQNQTLKLKQELSEQQDTINQYKHDIALLEETLDGVQNELMVKIEQIEKMEDCLLQAQNEKGSISDELTEVKNIHAKNIAEFEERLCILKDDIMNKDVTISELLNNENNLKESEMVAKKSLEEKSQETNDLQVKIELLRNDITSRDLEISDLLRNENDLKQKESSVKISLEEKNLEINHLRDQIKRITTALENSKNIIQKHLSDLARKTDMCSSLETQLNCLNEQLKAHNILYDEDVLQLKEQINAKEVIITDLTETNLKLNDDIQKLTEKAQGFTEKEEKEDKQDKFIKELQATIQRGQQHYNLLKDVVKSRDTEIEGLLKDLKCEKDLSSQLVSKNDTVVAQNYGLQKEVFELKEKNAVVESKLQSLLSSTSILFPQEVSDEFKLDNTCSLLKSLVEESAQCKNANVTIKKLEVNIRNALKRELDLKKQIASIATAFKATKDAKSEMEQQMYSLFSNSVTTPADLVLKVKKIIDENNMLKSPCNGDSDEIIQENKNLNEECEMMNKHIKELEETMGLVLDRENELKRVNLELKSRLEESNSHPQERLHEIYTLFPEAPSSLNSAIELIKTALDENSSLKEQLRDAKEDYVSLDTECESMYKAYQEKESLLNEVWKKEEALKMKEGEAREEIKRLNLEIERLKTGSLSSPNETPAGAKCGCDVLLAGLRSEVAARDAKLTALQLQIQTDSFPLRNTISELEQSLDQAKQRINELRGEVRRSQSQAQEDVTAQGLRMECLRCRDTKAILEQKERDITVLKSLCKTRKAKIVELEQAAGSKSTSRALRPPLKENLQSSSNSGSF